MRHPAPHNFMLGVSPTPPTSKHAREPLWNYKSNRHELLLLPSAELEKKTEASIKTLQLLGPDPQVPINLQMYRPGSDKDSFCVDITTPFSLIQAFAFAIANIECDIKG